MRTLSSRALAALAYEQGQDDDPATVLSVALLAALSLVGEARPLDCEPSARERERLRPRRGRSCLEERDEYGPITGPTGLLTARTDAWALDGHDVDGRRLTTSVPDGALL